MNLSMTGSLADRFKSGSQKAGNVTEAWGAENFYCPNCSSPKLDWLKPGTKAGDWLRGTLAVPLRVIALK